MKLTINTKDIQVNDEVIGFKGKVAAVTVFNHDVNVIFATGEMWFTSTYFVTTVIR